LKFQVQIAGLSAPVADDGDSDSRLGTFVSEWNVEKCRQEGLIHLFRGLLEICINSSFSFHRDWCCWRLEDKCMSGLELWGQQLFGNYLPR
jgi:hypothetical protein